MTITTEIRDIVPGLNDGLLRSLTFNVRATESDNGLFFDHPVVKMGEDFPEPAGGQVEEVMPPAEEGAEPTSRLVWSAYTQAELESIAESVAIAQQAYEKSKGGLSQLMPLPIIPAPAAAHIPNDEERKRLLADQVDSRIKYIYGRFMDCRMEYEMREAQAHEFKNGGYVGEPGKLVKGFATKSGLSYTAATDLTLAQANGLRGAIPLLGDLRMDKYTIANAATLQEAIDIYNATMAQVDVIERSL